MNPTTAGGTAAPESAAAPRKTATLKETTGVAQPKKAAARRKTTAPAEPATPEAATPEAATPAKVAPETVAPAMASPEAAGIEADAGAVGRAPGAVSARTDVDGLRATALRVLDHPGFAPELLALAAVQALGPGARDWAASLRNVYPDATADGLARLATRRFVRLAAAGGATAALAGLFAPVAELAAVLWTQANLVLHLAAAYGRDPADPERAVELLVLTRAHPDAESARVALAAAEAATDPVEQPWPRVAEAAWRLAAPLAVQAGGWLGLRVASRLVPGAAVLAAAVGGSAAAERLAARAVAAYRPPRAR
ncbi:hypothetical protein [Micromonospora sp. CA-111912]|uniref:hypothetical protein n=1 Tax=Micromonospora sp. CA-111912 TaxID=3239955 RepID=UPI003D90CB07